MKMLHASAMLLALFVAGCAGPSDRPTRDGVDSSSEADTSSQERSTSAMRTTQTEYALRESSYGYETTIAYTYTNSFVDTVYVVNCNGDVSPALQRQTTTGEWEDWWIPATNACLSPPVRVAHGERYSDSLRVIIASHDSATYRYVRSPSMPGTFRLIWHKALASYDYSHMSFDDEMPIEQRVSNPFVMRLEQ